MHGVQSFSQSIHPSSVVRGGGRKSKNLNQNNRASKPLFMQSQSQTGIFICELFFLFFLLFLSYFVVVCFLLVFHFSFRDWVFFSVLFAFF